MAKKIYFSVHRNPLPDSEGNATYLVRNANYGTVDTRDILDHRQQHGLAQEYLIEHGTICNGMICA